MQDEIAEYAQHVRALRLTVERAQQYLESVDATWALTRAGAVAALERAQSAYSTAKARAPAAGRTVPEKPTEEQRLADATARSCFGDGDD